MILLNEWTESTVFELQLINYSNGYSVYMIHLVHDSKQGQEASLVDLQHIAFMKHMHA